MNSNPIVLVVYGCLAASLAAPMYAQLLPPPTPGTSEWRFSGDSNGEVDKVGGPGKLSYADGIGGATDSVDVFTTTQAAGIPDIGGVDSPVLKFDYHNPNTLGYHLRALTGAPGDDNWIFSLVFDVYVDMSNNDGWLALWQGNANNSNDAELFLRPSLEAIYQRGSGTVAAGSWMRGTWIRVVNVVDYPNDAANPNSPDSGDVYIDGVLVHSGVAPDWFYDGLNNPCWILADENNETSQGYLANLAFTDVALTPAEVAQLGGAKHWGVFDFLQSVGSSYCSPATTNSTGLSAEILASGSEVVADQDLRLVVTQLPPGEFGYFLTSQLQGFIPLAGGSQGHLCLALPIGRFSQQIVNSGPAGEFMIPVNLTALPVTPVHSVLPGETWNFQCWYRDVNPGTTSNFSDGVSVLFQ